MVVCTFYNDFKQKKTVAASASMIFNGESGRFCCRKNNKISTATIQYRTTPFRTPGLHHSEHQDYTIQYSSPTPFSTALHRHHSVPAFILRIVLANEQRLLERGAETTLRSVGRNDDRLAVDYGHQQKLVDEILVVSEIAQLDVTQHPAELTVGHDARTAPLCLWTNILHLLT